MLPAPPRLPTAATPHSYGRAGSSRMAFCSAPGSSYLAHHLPLALQENVLSREGRRLASAAASRHSVGRRRGSRPVKPLLLALGYGGQVGDILTPAWPRLVDLQRWQCAVR